jgi:hypothetical protein
VSYWEQLGSKLRQLKGYIRNGTREDLFDHTCGIVGSMVEEIGKWWPVFPLDGFESCARQIQEAIHSKEAAKIDRAIKMVNASLGRALKINAKASSQNYLDFLHKSLMGSAGAAHALLKIFEKDGGQSYEEIDDTRALAQGPCIKDCMATRIRTWGIGKWKVLESSLAEDLQEAWGLIHQACSDPDLAKPKFALRHLRNILTAWPAKAGLGIDQWVIRLWGALPEEGLRVLLSIIYLAIDGIVHMQMLLVLIGLMPKDKGGERPIALTAMLYRVAMKLSKPGITQWDEEAAGFWDTAIKGSSCLRAALARALGMEATQARGFATVGLLWDMASFFDSIRIHRLVKLALQKGFPPRTLRLAMKVHTAARAFKEGPYISQFIQPTGVSILAGCGGSVSFARAALYEVLEGMHRDYMPCNIQSFVDDLPQVHMGPEEIILEQAIELATALASRLRKEGFEISGKSTIVAPSRQLAEKIAKELRRSGLELQVQDSARDLGVEFSGGARRRITIQKARLGRVRSGTKIVLKLGATTKQARKLQVTAIKPRAWGFAAQGCSPSMAKALRSFFGKGLNIKKAGGCLTTALHMHHFGSEDPLLGQALDNVLHFLQALLDQPRHQRLAVAQVWKEQRDKLAGGYRWAKVRGPMSSAIATLWDWGFEPVAVDSWIDPSGFIWTLDLDSPSLLGAVKEVLEHHMMKQIWTRAAEHHPDSLRVAPDFSAYLDLRRDFQKGSRQRHLYFLEAVVQGAMDCHTECHLELDKATHEIKCRLCQRTIAGEAAWRHFALDCPSLSCGLGGSFEETEAALNFELLRGQAQHESTLNPERGAYWLRGIMPLPTGDQLSLDFDFTSTYLGRLDVQGAVLGGDGSGGSYSSDPRLRSCGFGLVAIRPSDSYHFDYLGHSFGSVPGRQTAPRAEATSILHALRTTKGNASFICDNWAVCASFNKGDSYQPSVNGLLWQAVGIARKERLAKGYGFLEVSWIKSHLSYEEAINRGFEHFSWIANSFADTLADRAAALGKPQDSKVESTRFQTSQLKTILKRHIEIAVHLAPTGGRTSHSCQVSCPQISKLDRVRQLARGADHQLGDRNQCVRCGLRVPVERNLAYLEAILHLKCMGSVGAHFPSYQLLSTDGSYSHYMFGRTKVHATHVMATHFHLQVHFCTFCGAYGSKRSYNLQSPCPALPTKAGLEVIRLVSLGKRPDTYKARHEGRHGKQRPKVRPKLSACKPRLHTNLRRRILKPRHKNKQAPLANSDRLLEPHTPPFQEQPQEEVASGGGNPTSSSKPLDFSPSGPFSGLSKGDSLTPISDRIPERNRSSVLLGAASSTLSPAFCSRHGRHGSWQMTDFCHECDRIAEAALAASL